MLILLILTTGLRLSSLGMVYDIIWTHGKIILPVIRKYPEFSISKWYFSQALWQAYTY